MDVSVGIIMGSQSDWEVMQHATQTLEQLGIAHEARVTSAHRTPDATIQYASQLSARGVEVVIAAAGGAAHLAGVMAAKNTSNLIPLCHPLPLTKVDVRIELDDELPGFQVITEARTKGQTGCEMEALTGVSVAALTLFDMLKAVDHAMEIGGIRVIEKRGGKSGIYKRS